jgi:hypothetical protein
MTGAEDLRKIESFGDVAAEDDAVLEYFLSTNVVEQVSQNKTSLVLGRKGAGKTAIVRYFTEGPESIRSKSLNLRNYPWNVHSQRIDRGASDIEAYVSSWRYLVAVELASLLIEKFSYKGHSSFSKLTKFFEENYGGPRPRLADILRPKRLTLKKTSLQPSVMGNQLGSVDLERGDKDYQLGLELNAVSQAILDAVIEICGDMHVGALILHFDELDQGLNRLDEQRSRMITGLILAAREIRRECLGQSVDVNPVIYLRTDIWDELGFSDKNKISSTNTYNLEWNSESLAALVTERLRFRLGKDVKWKDITDDGLMRGSQTKWNHILARTFLRPRDVIKFLNAALQEAKKREDAPLVFGNKDIVNCRSEYSAYLKSELDDEIPPHFPAWDEALQACSAISTITFHKDAFFERYNERKSSDNPVDAEEALRILYRFSVVGYEKRSGYGGSSWAFQYIEPEAGWDNAATRFKVHLGLKEYAKLREERQ